MLYTIRDILKSHPRLEGKFIGARYLAPQIGSIGILTEGTDKIVREYTDGNKIRLFPFMLAAVIPDGNSDRGEGYDYMQSFAEYLKEYKNQGIIAFEQEGPPQIQKRSSANSIYTVKLNCFYIISTE
ncbi:MAG: hypothetical protein PHE51_05505 [Eubacteriales bacterium]|nr:hypothetical protein [Eubacteriales bacterium]